MMDETEENEEDDRNQYCTDLLTFIDRQNRDSFQPHKEQSHEESASKKELEEINFFHTTFSKEPQTLHLQDNWSQTENLPEVTLRKEFKIMGQNGRQWTKTKIILPQFSLPD